MILIGNNYLYGYDQVLCIYIENIALLQVIMSNMDNKNK